MPVTGYKIAQNDKRDRQKRMDRLLWPEITKLSSWELLVSTEKKNDQVTEPREDTNEHWNLLSKLQKKKTVFAPDSSDLDKGSHLGVTAAKIQGIRAHQFEQRLDKLEKVICQNAETHDSDTVDDVFECMNILERFFEATRSHRTLSWRRDSRIWVRRSRGWSLLSVAGATLPVTRSVPRSRRYSLRCHSSIFGCLFRVCFQIFLK